MSTPATKYWAFISYSHQDEAWATWLHRALETYRVPRRLVGRATPAGAVPRRLFPVFRDRDELPSSHELGAVLTRALAESRNLVVVCSPRSATSKWVNEEIKAFRALGRSHRVFCLIVDGEPHASANPEHAFAECFAPALRGDTGFEPIAADARPRKDGKDGAKLKLVAGLLGVGLDELKQREKQRRFWQTVQRTVAAVLVVGLLGGTWQWFSAQRAAREKEILVERLVENGRLELLDGRQARAAVYLNEALKLGHDTVPVRFMLGQAMQAVDALTDVRIEHGGDTVRRALFSPDGTRFVLLVARKDQVVAKVYDAATGRVLETFTDVPAHPRIVQFLPDGQHLFVSGFAEQTRDTESGPGVALWRSGREAPLLAVAGTTGRAGSPISPDGGTVAIATQSGVLVLRVADGAPVRTLAAGRTFTATAFDAGGELLATADGNGTIELWPTAGMRTARRLTGFEGQSIVGLEFTPDGKRVLALSAFGDIRIWDVQSGALAISFGADPRWVSRLAFSANGRRLLTVGSEGYKVWSAPRGILLFDLRNTLYRDADAALSADGNYVYTADDTAAVSEVWAVRSRTKLYTLDLHSGSTTAIALDSEGARLLLASDDGTAEIWRTGVNPHWAIDTGAMAPFRVLFAPGKNALMIAGGDYGVGEAFLLDRDRGQVTVRFSGHQHYIKDAALGVQGRRLLTAGADGMGAVWDVQSGKRIGGVQNSSAPFHLAGLNVQGTSGVFFAEALAPASRTAASLVDPESGTVLGTLGNDVPFTGYSYSPDGTRLATIDARGGVKIWDATRGMALAGFSAHAGEARTIAFDATGQRLLTAGADHAVRIWTVAGELLAALDEPTLGVVFHAGWSPDRDTIAASTESGTIWIWKPATQVLKALKGHRSTVSSTVFLADGKLLLSRGFDGTLRAWDPTGGTELAVIASLGDELTPIAVSSNERVIATGSVNRQVGLWNVGPEPRTAAELGAILACRSPWQISGTALIPVGVGFKACAKNEAPEK